MPKENKVTKSKEEILDERYQTGMHWKSVNRNNVLIAMDEYASQFRQPGVETAELPSDVGGSFPHPIAQEILDAAETCVASCRLTGKRHKEAIRFGFVNGVEWLKKFRRQ